MRSVRIVFAVIIFVTAVLAGVLAAWRADRWVKVEAGEYVAVESTKAASGNAVPGIERLTIDRVTNTAIFALLDGTQIEAQFVPRAKPSWPAGCPTNVHSTHMEVLDLRPEELVIGPATYYRPVLVRECPSHPVRVILRSDGKIGGGGVACLGASDCVRFAGEACGYEKPPTDYALPRSMKGYELYSWKAERQWFFTLITGTDRLKMLAEVTACRNTVDGDWIKITVRGADDLEAILALLPWDTYVGWRDSLDPAASGREPGERLELPPRRTMSEMQSYCSDLGIELQVVR